MVEEEFFIKFRLCSLEAHMEILISKSVEFYKKTNYNDAVS